MVQEQKVPRGGGEGGSQGDGEGKFPGGFWAAGSGRRMKDYRKDPSKRRRKREKWVHFLSFTKFISVGVLDTELVVGT